MICIKFYVHRINWLARPSRTSAETAPSLTWLYIESVGLFKSVAMVNLGITKTIKPKSTSIYKSKLLSIPVLSLTANLKKYFVDFVSF